MTHAHSAAVPFWPDELLSAAQVGIKSKVTSRLWDLGVTGVAKKKGSITLPKMSTRCKPPPNHEVSWPLEQTRGTRATGKAAQSGS